ncbi:hypothetical protein C8R44DRAFT_853827 [Mycena epipterygia]|nr:hypothetical protein C8R44DRAFT_853827 [Mycena epipterygia]
MQRPDNTILRNGYSTTPKPLEFMELGTANREFNGQYYARRRFQHEYLNNTLEKSTYFKCVVETTIGARFVAGEARFKRALRAYGPIVYPRSDETEENEPLQQQRESPLGIMRGGIRNHPTSGTLLWECLSVNTSGGKRSRRFRPNLLQVCPRVPFTFSETHRIQLLKMRIEYLCVSESIGDDGSGEKARCLFLLVHRQKSSTLADIADFPFNGYPSSSNFVDKFRVWSTSDGAAFVSIEEARETNGRGFPARKNAPGHSPKSSVKIDMSAHGEPAGRRALQPHLSAPVGDLTGASEPPHSRGRRDVFVRGDQIICVEASLENDDLPEGLLTHGEQEEFSQLIEARTHSASGGKSPGRHSFGHFPCAPMPRGLFDFDAHTMRIFSDREPCLLRDIDHWHTLLVDLTNHESYNRRAPRNPASCEISRGARSRLGKANLGEIIMMRICFSSSPPLLVPWDGAIHRGVWTGN